MLEEEQRGVMGDDLLADLKSRTRQRKSCVSSNPYGKTNRVRNTSRTLKTKNQVGSRLGRASWLLKACPLGSWETDEGLYPAGGIMLYVEVVKNEYRSGLM